MAITGNTQLAVTKADIISEMVQRELKYQAKLNGTTTTDVSMFAVKGAKTISFPRFGSLAVENRASAAAGTIQDITAAVDTLPLNYRAYVSWLIDSTDEFQSKVEVTQEYVKRAASAHARQLDEAVLAVLDASSGYQQTAGIDKTKILNARKWLLKNQADLSQCFIVVNPDDEALLLAINEFVAADVYGSSNIPNGVIGKIFGMNVMVHTKPDLAKSYIYSKEAIAFGLQMAPNYAEQDAIEYGTTSKRAAVDQLYGHKALQLGQGLDFAGAALGATLSPFIAEIG